jgi:hypothetical protein
VRSGEHVTLLIRLLIERSPALSIRRTVSMAKLVLPDVQFVTLTMEKEPPTVTLKAQGADGATVLSVKVGSDLKVLVTRSGEAEAPTPYAAGGGGLTVLAEVGEDGLVGIGAWPSLPKPELPQKPDLPSLPPPTKPGETPPETKPVEPSEPVATPQA